MLIEINGTYAVSVETKLLFKEKLDYIKGVLDDISSKLLKSENLNEDTYWSELGDCTNLNSEDFEFHTSIAIELKHQARNFPQIIYKSLLVSVYSILETTLSEILHFTEMNHSKKIKYKNLKKSGSEIDSIINFFELVHEIEFKSIEKQQNSLKEYANIRNNIVHRNGNLKDENPDRKNKIIKFAQSCTDLNIENELLIISNSKFVSDFISFISSFGLDFFDKIKLM